MILDVGDLPYRLIVQCTVQYWSQIAKCLMGLFGDLLREFHFINCGIVLVFIHRESFEILNMVKVVPIESLPVEYGGSCGTLEEMNGNYLKLSNLSIILIF
ncbi:hypothetical protein CHUAL_002832 [Chamberlinius hualienensis]